MSAVTFISAPFPAGVRDHFSRREYSSHDRRVELVSSLADVSGIIAHAEEEHGEISFFIEVFVGDRHGQNSAQPVLAIRGLIAMLAEIPGEDTHLVEVER